MYPNTTQSVAVVDQTAAARARYMAHVQRRSMPPRCSPITIVIIVLSLGMVFIGVTMLIVAHWPGASTIGENPLRIAGPVLLAVGVAVLILGVVLCYCLSMAYTTQWREKLSNFEAQRSSAVTNQPLMPSYPGAVYDPSDKSNRQSQEGSGPPYYSGNGKPFPVSQHPDPTNRPGRGDRSFDSNSQVPDPIRVTKNRGPSRGGPGSSTGSANDSSEIGAADLGGLGVYSPPGKRTTSPTNAYANVGYEHTEGYNRGGEFGAVRAQGRGGSDAPPSYDQLQRARNPEVQQQQLRVQIRAEPGTAVHITPSATPPLATPPKGRNEKAKRYKAPPPARLQHGDSSAETEI